MSLVDALHVARRCYRIIMVNFAGTLVVDGTGVALAAWGLLDPLVAAFIHVSSELAFILNSARLLRPDSGARCARVGSIPPMVALISFALFLTSPELLHAHGGGLGLHSAECPFADVTARHDAAALPSPPTINATWSSVGRAQASAIDHALPRCARYTDPRAPPLV